MDDLLSQLRDLSSDERAAALQALGADDNPTIPAQPERIIVTQQSQFTRKLRLFSGKTPVPNGEVDFETWRPQVRQLFDEAEDELSDKQLRRVIIQSLQRPALDTVKNHIGNTRQLLEILDNLYGAVVDSKELLIQYYSVYQRDKEQTSSYLQRLYLLIMDVADKGGVSVGKIPDLLLEQFIRGSHDEVMIQKLDLEDLVSDPPSFAELLLSIRKEEARKTEKRLRLKSNGRIAATIVSSPGAIGNDCGDSQEKKQVKELCERLALLEAQVKHQHMPSSNLAVQPSQSRNPAPHKHTGATTSQRLKQSNKQKLKCFCYRCGEDGHCANGCEKEPNAELVQKKLLLRCSGN